MGIYVLENCRKLCFSLFFQSSVKNLSLNWLFYLEVKLFDSDNMGIAAYEGTGMSGKKSPKPKQDSYPVVLHTGFIRATSRAWMASSSGTVCPLWRCWFNARANSLSGCWFNTSRMACPILRRCNPYTLANFLATAKHFDFNTQLLGKQHHNLAVC